MLHTCIQRRKIFIRCWQWCKLLSFCRWCKVRFIWKQKQKQQSKCCTWRGSGPINVLRPDWSDVEGKERSRTRTRTWTNTTAEHTYAERKKPKQKMPTSISPSVDFSASSASPSSSSSPSSYTSTYTDVPSPSHIYADNTKYDNACKHTFQLHPFKLLHNSDSYIC